MSAAGETIAGVAPAALPTPRVATTYTAEVSDDVEAFLGRCQRMAHADGLPFQGASWLRAWYDAFSDADGRSGRRGRSDPGNGAGNGAGRGAGSHAGSGAGSGARSGAGTAARSDAGTGARSGAGTGARSDAGTGARSDAGTGARSDAGTGARSGAGTGAGTGAGSDPSRRPVLVTVRRADGSEVMLLPLVGERRYGLSTLRWADATVVDYALPLLAADWHGGEAPTTAARRLWRAVRTALRGHDVLRIDKMLTTTLAEAGAVPNPLASALHTRPCAMFGNELHIPGDYDAWRHTLDKRVRKEFERCWRVYTRSAEARFEHVTDPAEAVPLFEALEAQQSLRMRAAGSRYVLDEPAYRRFYREVLLAGLADGSAVLTCLRDGPHLVAALFGIANRGRFIALRLSTGDPAWANCSPGRLLLERTAHHLHGAGMRRFDFGIGAYAHKAVFQVERIALVDAVEALSWRGLPVVWAAQAKAWLKQQDGLMQLVRPRG